MDFLFALIAGFALGFVAYSADRRRGQQWFRKWYDLTHKDPLTSPPVHGLVFGTSAVNKLGWAAVLAAVTALILFLMGMGHPLTAVTAAIGVCAGVALAFFTAPLVFKMDRARVNEVLQKLDETQRPPVANQPLAGEAADPISPEPVPPVQKAPDASDSDGNSGPEDWRSGVKKFLDS